MVSAAEAVPEVVAAPARRRPGLVERVEEVAATIFFAATALFVFAGAIGRSLGSPLIWSVDLAQLTFVWAAVLGADIALKRNQHIEIDILIRRFPQGVRRLLAIAWLMLIAAFLAALVWLGTQLTLLNLERELGDVGISYGWVTAAIPVGALLMLITVLVRLVRGLMGRETLSLEGHDGTVL
jgi:TRAP-type C4-dicarboxylate transport system permease small subunit